MLTFIFHSLLFSSLFGAILGRIYMRFVPDLAYQLLPTWLFAGILSCFITLALSCGFALLFDNHISLNFTLFVAINVALSEVLLLWIMYQSLTDK